MGGMLNMFPNKDLLHNACITYLRMTFTKDIKETWDKVAEIIGISED